ncbi:Protein DEL-7, partial [Aphelenchoides avenae]
LFDKCFYSSEKMDCCTMFRPTYVMLRGRCFRMIEFHQVDEDQHGKLKFEFKQLPSPLVDNNRGQQQIVVYLTDNYTDVGNYPRLYFHSFIYLLHKAVRQELNIGK